MVVERRQPKPLFLGEFTCQGTLAEHDRRIVPCGSRLAITSGNVYRVTVPDATDEDLVSYGFKCPVCGGETDMPDGYISAIWAGAILSRAQYLKEMEIARIESDSGGK